MTGDIPKNPAQHVFSKQDLNWRKMKIVVPTLALSVTKVSDVNSGWNKKKALNNKEDGTLRPLLTEFEVIFELDCVYST